MIASLVSLLVLPSTLDAVPRAILLFASRRSPRDEPLEKPDHWLVLIPARDEGELVRSTLASVRAAAGSFTEGQSLSRVARPFARSNPAPGEPAVRAVLLLDGDDDRASEIARELGCEVRIKSPAGPTKGVALGWLANQIPQEVRESDAVLLLDVGSVVSESFFDDFRWPATADGAQVRLEGTALGVGEGVRSSERSAQSAEDEGRERLGWAVRLRGTGTVLRPAAFLEVAGRLVTQAEDEEATLLLASRGFRLVLSQGAAFVVDEKPARWRAAATQRARWIAGRLEILLRHPRAFVRLFALRPGDGLAFLLDMFGRPLSLTVPLRLLGGAWLIAPAIEGGSIPWTAFVGAAALLSGLFEGATVLRSGVTLRGALGLMLAWIGALVLAPRALFRWMRARRS